MITPPPLLLLSDVDGTLIGDEGGLPVPAHELRDRLAHVAGQWGGPFHLGLASSRTLRELTVLQRALRLPGPCIAEDGARWATDAADADATDADATDADATDAEAGRISPAAALIERHGRRILTVHERALPAPVLRSTMSDRPAFTRADTQRLPDDALHALGFRSVGSRARALHGRTHSVLLDPQRWSHEELSELQSMCAARGLQLRRGGRWYTLTTAGGKGPALRALRHHFAVSGVSPVVAAIGNEENDRSLLAEADLRFVIRNPHRGPHPVLSSLPDVSILDTEGTGGWMEMLERLVPSAKVWLESRA